MRNCRSAVFSASRSVALRAIAPSLTSAAGPWDDLNLPRSPHTPQRKVRGQMALSKQGDLAGFGAVARLEMESVETSREAVVAEIGPVPVDEVSAAGLDADRE